MKIVKLGSVVDILNGYAFKSEWFVDSGTKIIRIGDISDNKVNTGKCVCIDEEKHRFPDSCRAQNNDILMALSGATTGKIGIVDEDLDGALVNQRVAIIRSQNLHTQKYIQYIFTGHILEKLLSNAWGAAQPNLSPNSLKALEIPLPPLEEQKRIAAILDKADRIRRKRQEAIRLTEELGRSIFLDMFGDPVTNPKGWRITKIETIAAKEKNSMAIGPFGSNLKVSDYREFGYPIIFVKDVKENNFNWSSNRYVDEKKFKELSSHQVNSLDVLATKMGTPPCVSAVYPKSMPTGVITADLIKIAVSVSEAIPSYVSIVINSEFCKQQVERITEGITRPKVTLREFKKILIPIPPLDKQKEWEYKHEQVNLIKQKNRDQLSQLDELFNSLLQRAFRGEL